MSEDQSPELRVFSVGDLPEILPGDDLADILTSRFQFAGKDVLVLAQKIVSKSEGRLVSLGTVIPGTEAVRVGAQADKDPRLVQLILDESRRIVRVRPGLIIVEDRRGWVCANAGIDRSNIVQSGTDEIVCMLPVDPDLSAMKLRDRIRELTGAVIGVVINDSHGRAWREGTVGVAIGAAGVTVRDDRRGEADRNGYVLQHTIVGAADELAATASVVMGQGSEGRPAVVIRGLDVEGDGKAGELQRPAEFDLFR